ncbi:acetylcholine receptor subunit delta-like [Aplysia californica]|uniref:Acetylcholine receptor subunit delta-like n=1 Tax=Aplysia californica TaxID=6500 RepID=A0ABM1AB35_APLCA|nr:acetylcholine receptor subunit delta-like [Aplysia californica]
MGLSEIRPLNNQSHAVNVGVGFDLIAIAGLDDVTSTFTCNGFLYLTWEDQRLAWDPAKYGGIEMMSPMPIRIWRPRLIVVNTVGDRDIFEDDNAPTIVMANGSTSWKPGGLFPIRFRMKREPFAVMMTTILPAIFLTLLVIFVFAIPVESGEKISYGITVLLALALFMSLTSSMVSRSSATSALVVIYIFILLVVSVLAVIVCIIVVVFHNMEERTDKNKKENKMGSLPTVTKVTENKCPSSKLSLNRVHPQQTEEAHLDETSGTAHAPAITYRRIGQLINNISFKVRGQCRHTRLKDLQFRRWFWMQINFAIATAHTLCFI